MRNFCLDDDVNVEDFEKISWVELKSTLSPHFEAARSGMYKQISYCLFLSKTMFLLNDCNYNLDLLKIDFLANKFLKSILLK